MIDWVKYAIASSILAGACVLTWHVTTLQWENKWQARDLSDEKWRVKYTEDLRNIEHVWADQFATLQSWYQTELDKNRDEADKTIAGYRAGNLKLRNQFTCMGKSVSDTSTPGQITDAARDCGLQSRDVEFLIRYSERAQAVVIKYNKAVKALGIIYEQK